MKKSFLPLLATMLLLVNCAKDDTNLDMSKSSESTNNQSVLKEKELENLKIPYIIDEPVTKGSKTTIGGTDYAHLFHEDFNSKTLNTDIWNTTHRVKEWSGGYSIEWNKNGSSDYTLTGTQLHLKITRTNSTISCGRLDTKGKKAFRYGFFEARIKFPSPKGYWGAFWSMPNLDGGMVGSDVKDNNVGTDGAEIDIIEANKSGSYSLGMHIDGYGKGHDAWSGTKSSSSLYSDFHTYGIKWGKNSLTYYYDGKAVKSIPSDKSDWVPQVWQYAILCMDSKPDAEDWCGTFDPKVSLSNVVMQVDWIKIHWND